MNTKEKQNKKRKHLKITPKRIVVTLVVIVFALYMLQFYIYYFADGKVFGMKNSNEKEVNAEAESSEEIKISEATEVNVDEIISKNANVNSNENIEKVEVDLEYITKYRNNNELPEGMVQVVQEGRTGRQEVVIKKKYENGEVVSEEQISSKIIKASVNKIVEIGTSQIKVSNHNVQKGEKVYVTSARASVKAEPNDDSEKMTTISKDTELTVLDIQDGWYRVYVNNIYGWVKAESTTYINPNKAIEEEQQTTTGKQEKSKQELMKTLDFNMNLNCPSGLSLDQFRRILVDDKDTQNVIQNNAEYFYYIEEQYNINGVFIASMAIHESAWGTSKIANNKKNLFGYGAYDSNPYSYAYNFTTYSESIDLVARALVKYYLNPEGTSIYGGETAVGTYYNGPTLTGVNTRYASDKNWDAKVYSYMEYLYNKL